MKRFDTVLFLAFIRVLESFTPTRQADDKPLWEDSREKLRRIHRDWESDLLIQGLIASAATSRKILRLVSDSEKTPTVGEIRRLSEELSERLIDETSAMSFFSLSASEAQMYNQPRAGWQEIISRFPNIVDDVEEARKCFALSRYSGAVFHSLQIVEVGLIELGTFIGVTDPHSGWTAVANQLKKIVSKKYDDRTEFEKTHAAFLEQVQATVEALKNAWRNKISHAQGRLVLMTKDFSPEVSEEILFATRAFMRRLSEGLPSSGSAT